MTRRMAAACLLAGAVGGSVTAWWVLRCAESWAGEHSGADESGTTRPYCPSCGQQCGRMCRVDAVSGNIVHAENGMPAHPYGGVW